MRIATLVLLCLVLAGCKKKPEPTLPRIPDSTITGWGGVQETGQSILYHIIYQYSGHSNQALAFYAPEMEKRGAKRVGDQYVDDNLVNAGGFGRDSAVAPKDPGRSGVYVAVLETSDATHIDVWENVPKAP